MVLWSSSNFNNYVPSIGEFYQGGIVFWIDPNDSTQGLVSDISDLQQSQYGCTGDPLNMYYGSGGMMTGYNYTESIVANCPNPNIAAAKMFQPC